MFLQLFSFYIGLRKFILDLYAMSLLVRFDFTFRKVQKVPATFIFGVRRNLHPAGVIFQTHARISYAFWITGGKVENAEDQERGNDDGCDKLEGIFEGNPLHHCTVDLVQRGSEGQSDEPGEQELLASPSRGHHCE